MSGAVAQVMPLVAIASSGVAGALFFGLFADTARARKRKRDAMRHQESLAFAEGSAVGGSVGWRLPRGDLPAWPLAYAQKISRALSYRSTRALSPQVRSGRAKASHMAAFLSEHAEKAGCRRVDVDGFVEARFRLTLGAAAIGMLLGAAFSTEAMLVLGVAGGALGWRALSESMLSLERRRGAQAEERVSEMLEVVALGLRSGLTFDRSFAMYGEHFDSPFAQSCASACRSWSLGLSSRDESLRNLAASYDCETLERAVEGAIRSLRFGASFADDLEEMAAQSRAAYRAAVGEKVAKAPVKMMLPTGALILPAMLILVLGPILLELAQGF